MRSIPKVQVGTHETQQLEAEPLGRPLDLADDLVEILRGRLPPRSTHHDRVVREHEADGARQVDALGRGIPAMAQDIDEDGRGRRPFSEDMGQRRHDHVLRSSSAAQETTRVVRSEVDVDRSGGCIGVPVPTRGEVERQPSHLVPWEAQPLGGGVGDPRRPRQSLELQGPGAEWRGLGRQRDAGTDRGMAIGSLQVLPEDPERQAVHREVVDGHEQEVGGLGAALEMGHADEQPLAQVEALLEAPADPLDGGGALLCRRSRKVVRLDDDLVRRLHDLLAPGPVITPQPQAQRIVMAHHREDRVAERARRQALGPDQRGDVPLVRIGRVALGQETKLGRRERQGARRIVLDIRGDALRSGSQRQLRDRLVPEDRVRREADALAVRAHDAAQRQQRVTAQVEEVVVDAHLLEAQELLPDPHERRLRPIPRGEVVDGEVRSLTARIGQPGTVDLPVRGHGEGVELHEQRRHHVVGERLAQVAAKLRHVHVPAILGHDVGDQALRVAVAVTRDHGALTDDRVSPQDGLDLAQLDAEPADLDLEVRPTEILDAAVRPTTHHVPGPVQPTRGGTIEAMLDEPPAREVLATVVAPRQSDAADVQLPRDAQWLRCECRVQHVQLRVGDGLAKGDRVTRQHLGDRRPDGRLGRSVHVPERSDPGAERNRQLCAESLAAAQRLEARRARPSRVEQQLPGRRGRLHHGDVADSEPLAQPHGVHRLVLVCQHERGTRDERQEQLEPGDVERHRGHREQRVGRLEAGAQSHRLEQVGERDMWDLDALGAPCRARRVDGVGQVGRADLEAKVRGVERLDPRRVAVERDDRRSGCRHLADERLLGDQDMQRRVFGDHREPFAGEQRIERHIGTARLVRREERDDHVRGAVDMDPHEPVRANAQRAEMPSEPVRASVQLAIRERPGRAADGHPVGPSRRQELEPLVGRATGDGHRRRVPAGEQVQALHLGQELQIRHGCGRRRRHLTQQLDVVAQPALDRPGLEHGLRPLEVHEEVVVRLGEVGLEVERAVASTPGAPLCRLQPLEPDAGRQRLERHDRRDEGGTAGLPWQMQGRGEPGHGVVLVIERIERAALEAHQMIGDAVPRCDAHPQGQQPCAQAHQVRRTHGRLPGDEHTAREVGLTREAMEQDLPRPEKHREGRDTRLDGEPAHGLGEIEIRWPAAATRTRTIGRVTGHGPWGGRAVPEDPDTAPARTPPMPPPAPCATPHRRRTGSARRRTVTRP